MRRGGEQLILMREEDSIGLAHGLFESLQDFPEGGEPALIGHVHPGKHRLEASSAQELPGPERKREISVVRCLPVAPYRNFPPATPTRGIVASPKLLKQKTGERVATPQVTRSEGTKGSGRIWASDLLTSPLGLGESP
jgi:hypothetical protein